MSLEAAIEQLITSKEVHLVHLLPQLLLGGLHLLQQHPVAHLTSSQTASHELLDFAVYSEPLDTLALILQRPLIKRLKETCMAASCASLLARCTPTR